MECRVLMPGLRHILLLTAAFVLLPCNARAERQVVLVTGDSCPVREVSSLDVRKAYLGVTVSVDGSRLRPIRLIGDEMLSSIFYQSVVHMSRKSYERRALSLALKYGTPRLEMVDSVDDAAQAVRGRECGVVYMWKDDVDRLSGIKTVRLLWQGE